MAPAVLRSYFGTTHDFFNWVKARQHNAFKLTLFRNGNLVANRWKLQKCLGRGGYGAVFHAAGANNTIVAVKLETSVTRVPSLRWEYKIYQILHAAPDDATGIPSVHFYGRHGNSSALVVDRLGLSLEERMMEQGGQLPLTTVLMIGIQVLTRLEYIHARGILHNDVKPANVLTGWSDPDRLYMIDFGVAELCTKLPPSTQKSPKQGTTGGGTPYYMSRWGMRGYERSWRDDLESFVYLLVELRKGTLPWNKVSNDDVVRMLRVKEITGVETLCKGMGKGINKMAKDILGMAFKDMPRYGEWKSELYEQLNIATGSEEMKLVWGKK